MIADWEKNEIFVSSLLKEWSKLEYINIQKLLTKHFIELKTIKQTKDVWARDYMPIQISKEEYIQFRYEPDYLDGYDEQRTIPSEIELLSKYPIQISNINLDGGNIVCAENKVILTDRVLIENPSLSKKEIKNELTRLLKAEVYFVPAIKSDMTGHIDGHLRFIDNETVIVNQLDKEYQYWQKGFLDMIQDSGLKYVEMPWYEDKKDSTRKSAIGSYLNYLQLENLILFPVFEEYPEIDELALKQLKNVYPNTPIEAININAIGKEGGLMNCISWTIFE